MRHVTDAERRVRIGVRHALAPSARVDTPEDVTRTMTVLHATEAASVHLACWARSRTLTTTDVDHALYERRSLVKQLSMRRTLFVFPRDLVPAAWGSASARVATTTRRQLGMLAEQAGVAASGEGDTWVRIAEEAVLRRLAAGDHLTSREIREQVPEAEGRLGHGAGTTWAGTSPLAPRLINLMHLDALVARTTNDGHWRLNRPRWGTTTTWLGEMPAPVPKREGYARIVERWLRTFGPGTVDDLAWWLGATKGDVRAALADVGAVEVSLDGGATGWLAADDLEPVASPEPWVALLPVLDPTVMGWKQRAFYLGEQAPMLFDSVGNAGTTAWVDGRVVGAWVQDDHGVVRLRLLESVTDHQRHLLEAEAARLTEWLDGQRVFTVYPSPLMRADPAR